LTYKNLYLQQDKETSPLLLSGNFHLQPYVAQWSYHFFPNVSRGSTKNQKSPLAAGFSGEPEVTDDR